MNKLNQDVLAGVLGGLLASIVMFWITYTGELTFAVIIGCFFLAVGFSLLPLEKIWTIPASLVNYVLSSVFS